MWKSIARSSIGQYRQTDQYANGPFIIQLMRVLVLTCGTLESGET